MKRPDRKAIYDDLVLRAVPAAPEKATPRQKVLWMFGIVCIWIGTAMATWAVIMIGCEVAKGMGGR